MSSYHPLREESRLSCVEAFARGREGMGAGNVPLGAMPFAVSGGRSMQCMCWTRVLKPQCCRALQPRCPCLWETGSEPGSVLLRLLLRSERLCESEIAERMWYTGRRSERS